MWFKMPAGAHAISIEQQEFAVVDGLVEIPDHFAARALSVGLVQVPPPEAPTPEPPPPEGSQSSG